MAMVAARYCCRKDMEKVMSMFDLSETIEEMDGMDMLKVAGGAIAGIGALVALPVFGTIGTITKGGMILGSLLGAGGGLAMVAEDKEERKAIKYGAAYEQEQDWNESVAARQTLVDSANSMTGYFQAVKLTYALAASCLAKCSDGDEVEFEHAKKHLDGMLSIWLPDDLKDELQLLFHNAPTFYDVGLMLRDAFHRHELDASKFMAASEKVLAYLDRKEIISQQNIHDEWEAFKVGLITKPDGSDETKGAAPEEQLG
jgi:hypothetical protein